MLLSKRTLIGVLLFSSCTTCPKWEKTDIKADCLSASRRTFPAQSEFNGIELEFTDYPDGERLYANTFSRLMEPGEVVVTLKLPDESLTGKGIVYQGGQRVELPSEWIPLIRENYSANNDLLLSFDRFNARVPSDGFYDSSFRIYSINLGIN
ncbi:MAG: hypothetical protein ACK4HV_01595 [Parachlamydiaceae bacterium]